MAATTFPGTITTTDAITSATQHLNGGTSLLHMRVREWAWAAVSLMAAVHCTGGVLVDEEGAVSSSPRFGCSWRTHTLGHFAY